MATFILILGAIAVIALVLSRTLDMSTTALPMPFACPKCHAGEDTDFLDRPRSWYVDQKSGRVSCRSCQRWFKEHPDGSLVEDPDAFR